MTTRASASVLNLTGPAITDIKIIGPNATIDNTIIGASVPNSATFSNFVTITGLSGATRGNLLSTTIATTVAGVTTNTLSTRWSIIESNEVETGANVGSNLVIGRYDDNGIYIENVLTINRATGIVYFSHPPTYTGDTNGLIPAGMIMWFAGSSAPDGFLVADGSALSTTTFSALFSAIQYAHGGSNGTFHIPDMRGVFVRGLDNGRGLDPNRVLGSYQTDTYGSHLHTINDNGHIHNINDPQHNHGITDNQHNHGITDNQHNHGITDNQHCHGGGFNLNYGDGVGGGGSYIPTYPNSGYSTTGITINNSYTGIGINNSGTGITINNNGTGITIVSGSTGITLNNSGGTETAPKNIALLACIKY